MLSMQNMANLSLGAGVTVSHRTVRTTVARFDLSCTFTERQADEDNRGGLTGHVMYASDLFDEATAQDVAGRLVSLLRAVAEDPRVRPLSEMSPPPGGSC
jgi:hypothetical protein